MAKLTAEEIEYQMKYGGLPNDREALLAKVKELYPFSQQQLDLAMAKLEELEWQTVEFTLNLIPKPTPRPRTDGNHFYVKGAGKNKRMIRRYIEKNIISTRCKIDMVAYLPIPISQMNHAEIFMAEAGLIVPITMADVDNLMKTYLDMITGHLLLNDNLVSEGYLAKRYSIKPRLDIKLEYQNGFDSKYNERRVTRSKIYLEEFTKGSTPK